jgi:DNA-binding transcriptional regulator GbsR (MarR family)
MNDFEKNLIHDIEELSELTKELTKWLRGSLREEKLIEEIHDTKIAISDIEKRLQQYKNRKERGSL